MAVGGRRKKKKEEEERIVECLETKTINAKMLSSTERQNCREEGEIFPSFYGCIH